MVTTQQKRLLFMAGMALLCLLAMGFLQQPEPPKTNDYYSGPIASKSHPGQWVTEDGKFVPPPPGTKPSEVPLHRRSGDL